MYTPTLTVSNEFFRAELITKKLPEFVQQLKSYFTKDTVNYAALDDFPIVNSNFWRLIAGYSYADLGEKLIFVPAGIKITYLEYLDILSEAVTINADLLPNVLVPYARWLGELIEEPDKLRSIGGSKAIAAFKPHNLDAINSKLGQCFKLGDNNTQRPFKTMFKRNKDLGETFQRTVILINQYKAIDWKEVKLQVQGISELLTVMLDKLEHNEISLSGNESGRDYLSSLTRSLAREIEFYAVIGYQLTQLAVALKNTRKAL